MTYGRVRAAQDSLYLDGAAVSHSAELVRGDLLTCGTEGPLIRPSGTFSPRAEGVHARSCCNHADSDCCCRRNAGRYFFGGLASPGSVGPPASFQALKPPRMWATGFRPMSCAVLAASAERRPPAQKNTNFLSSPNFSL